MKNFIALSLIAFFTIDIHAQVNYRSSAPDFNSSVQTLIPWGDSVIIKKELGKEVLASGTHFLVGTNGYSNDAVGNPDIFGQTYQVENNFLFHIGRRLNSNVSDQLVKVNLADGNTDYLELPIETQGLTNGSKVAEMEIFNGFIYLLADNLSVGRKILRVEVSTLTLDNTWNNQFNQNQWVNDIHSIDLINDQLVFLSENSGSYSLQGYDLNNQNVTQLANVQPFGVEGKFSELTAINDTLFTYPVNVNGVATQYFYSSNGYANNIQVTGEVLQSFQWNGSFYLAGSFQLNGQTEYLAELNLNSMTLQAVQGFNGKIKNVSPTANQIEILGDFTAFNGVPANGKVLLDNQLSVLYDFSSSSISENKHHAYINGNDTLFIGGQLKVLGADLAEEIIYNPITNQFEDIPSYLQGKIEEGRINMGKLYFDKATPQGLHEYYRLSLGNGDIEKVGSFFYGGNQIYTDFSNRWVYSDTVFNPATANAYIIAHNLDDFIDTIHIQLPWFKSVLDFDISASKIFIVGTISKPFPGPALALQLFEFNRSDGKNRLNVYVDYFYNGGSQYGIYRGVKIDYNQYHNHLNLGFTENGTFGYKTFEIHTIDLENMYLIDLVEGNSENEEADWFTLYGLVNTHNGYVASGDKTTNTFAAGNRAYNSFFHYDLNSGFQFIENTTPNFRDSVRLELNHLVGTPNYIYGGADRPGLRAFVVFERPTTYTSVKESDVLTSALSTLNVYPVPADKQLNIELKNEQNQTVQICDLAGRVILQQRLNSGLNTLDISELNSGVYFVILPKTGESLKWIKN